MLRHNDVITMAFHGPHRRGALAAPAAGTRRSDALATACISFTFQLMATVEERLNCVMQSSCPSARLAAPPPPT